MVTTEQIGFKVKKRYTLLALKVGESEQSPVLETNKRIRFEGLGILQMECLMDHLIVSENLTTNHLMCLLTDV